MGNAVRNFADANANGNRAFSLSFRFVVIVLGVTVHIRAETQNVKRDDGKKIALWVFCSSERLL